MTRAAKRKSPSKIKRPAVVVLGFGRVGGAISSGLLAAGYQVSALPRSAESVRRAVQMRVPLADHEDLKRADLCIFSVPDAAIPAATAMVLNDLRADAALVHCSGALTLATFGVEARGRALGSFHPLAAVSDPSDSLSGYSVAIAGSAPTLRKQLAAMARALEMPSLEVPESGRAAYHAGAVLSAGLLVSLLDAAMTAFEHAGVDRQAALTSLVPLMRSALNGVAERGPTRGLTGPVVRGDVAVVQAHLDSLPADVGAIYRLLSRRALRLAASLPSETALALERILA